MKRRAALLTVLAVGAAVLAVALMRHPTLRIGAAATHTAATAPDGAPRGSATLADGSAPLAEEEAGSRAPTRELVGTDAAAAARQWQAHAKRVAFAKQVKEFGAEVARLMQLPPDQAFGPLAERARNGDMAAAAAAGLIASSCRPSPAAPERASPVSFAAHVYPTLPDGWKTFVDRVHDVQRAEHDERARHCVGVGDVVDWAELMIDEYLRPENPDLSIDVAADNKDVTQAIADVRELAARHPTPHAQSVLGDVLLKSADAGDQTEGRAILERLAADDPAVASRLAYCLESGCGAFRGDPAAAMPWIERGAALGDQMSLMLLIPRLEASGAISDAWTWSLFQLDLALAGCFETNYPSYVYVAGAAKDEARLRARLAPAEQNAGLAAYYAISGKSARDARERLDCAD